MRKSLTAFLHVVKDRGRSRDIQSLVLMGATIERCNTQQQHVPDCLPDRQQEVHLCGRRLHQVQRSVVVEGGQGTICLCQGAYDLSDIHPHGELIREKQTNCHSCVMGDSSDQSFISQLDCDASV